MQLFNLIDEPWVQVRDREGNVSEVSLRTALENAHLYAGLAGETPTQDVSVERIILALLHTIFSRYDTDGKYVPITSKEVALSRWASLWKNGKFPMDVVDEYFKQWHERFYLFDDNYPFFQSIKAKNYSKSGVQKMMGDLVESNTKPRFFTTRSGDEKTTLRFGEAARWLFYLNNWDDTALKPSREAKSVEGRANGKKGWLGDLGYVEAVGKTLFATLMLNLVMLKDGEEIWNMDDCVPVWELDEQPTEELRCITAPNHPASFYTIQYRRTYLEQNGSRVLAYKTFSGDQVTLRNQFVEQHTIWGARTDKETGEVFFMPKTHSASRKMWQEFASLATINADATLGHTPGIVAWLSTLMAEGMVDKTALMRFRMVAMQYDSSMSHTVQDMYSDELSFHANLLTRVSDEWREKIVEEVKNCDKLAFYYGLLVDNILKAAGRSTVDDTKKTDQNVEMAKGQFYFAIDFMFRNWLMSLSEEQTEEEKKDAVEALRKKLYQIAMDMGKEEVKRAGKPAFIGKYVTEKNKTAHYSSPEAYSQFCYLVNALVFKKNDVSEETVEEAEEEVKE